MTKGRTDAGCRVLAAVVLALLCGLAGSGCTMENPLPYAMTAGELRFGRMEGVCSVAGVFFRLVNTSGREITAVEMTCTIYDHTGRASPLIGGNTIRSRLEVRMAAGEERSCVWYWTAMCREFRRKGRNGWWISCIPAALSMPTAAAGATPWDWREEEDDG